MWEGEAGAAVKMVDLIIILIILPLLTLLLAGAEEEIGNGLNKMAECSRVPLLLLYSVIQIQLLWSPQFN